MASEAQRKANREYDKLNTKKITFKLNLNTDRDILDFLNAEKNKQGLFKSLMRGEIKKRNRKLKKTLDNI